VDEHHRLGRDPADYPEQLEGAQRRMLEFQFHGREPFRVAFRESLQQQQFQSLRLVQSLEQLQRDGLPAEQLLQQRRELLETIQGLLRQQERLRPLTPLLEFSPEELTAQEKQLRTLDRRLRSVLQRLVLSAPENFDPEQELQILAQQRRIQRPLPLAEPFPAVAKPRYLLQLREAQDLPPALREGQGKTLFRIPGRYMATRWWPAEDPGDQKEDG
jgi:hypothetical protein